MQDVLEIQVAPLSPASGARISGVDLTRSALCRDRAGNPGRLEQAHCVKRHAIGTPIGMNRGSDSLSVQTLDLVGKPDQGAS